MKKEEAKPESVTLSKEQFDELVTRIDNAEKNAKKTVGIETSVHRLLSKPQPPEPDPMTEQDKIEVVDELSLMNGKLIKNSCPYCKKYHADKLSIQDYIENTGNYSCRRCGKSWYPWAIKPSELSGESYTYSEALEKGDKKLVEKRERFQMAKRGLPVEIEEGSD